MATTRCMRLLVSGALTASSLAAVSFGSLGGASAAAAASLPKCSVSALGKATGVVDVDFWESASQANQTTLQALTNTFNSSQSKVHVNLVQQAGYDDTWNKVQAGLTNGQLPDIAQLEDQRTQGVIDSGAFLPVQSCMNASKYSTSDFLTRPLNYWKVNGVQWALPFAVSAPIVFYNKLAFTKAGLNPNNPPLDMSALLLDAKALKASGSGMGLVLDPWHLETWLASANQLFVNNSNGRSARATKGSFNTSIGVQIFSDLKELVTSGDATTNSSTGPDEFDNLLGIGSGKYGMTIETSAALGTVTTLLSQYPNVQLGVGPFPVLNPNIRGGIEPGGSALYISAKSSPAKQAAAWEYDEFLESSSSVATWAAGTGYIPTRKSSTQTAIIQRLWQSDPYYKVAYNQMLNGLNSPGTSGSVIGPYADVRAALLAAEQSMYLSNVSPKAAVSSAESNVNNIISQYNQRLGVS